MPATPFDSAIYKDLLGDAEVGQLFTDSAEVRAMLLVEGALAKAQGAVGMIPEVSAAAIHRASMEVQIDPAGLSAETGRSAVSVPALVAAFRGAIDAPEHAQYIHWGATSQDIMDSGLVLRLRQVLALYEARINAVLISLAALAEAHAETPIAGRTYGQVATPTTFGAVVASWGAPLLGMFTKLAQVRADVLHISLSGAAGTLSAMGEKGPAVRAKLAENLGLSDPGGTWHSTRDTIAGFSGWATQVATTLGKIGEDLLLMTQSGIGEVRLGTSGGSSTMPQKANPVAPSVLVALARHTVGLNATLQASALHRQQRDAAAWITEWIALPQICISVGRALKTAEALLPGISPDTERMALLIDDDGLGLIYAEALSFALAAAIPRPEAQRVTKSLCEEARDTATPLRELATRDFPDIDLEALFTPEAQLGTAPEEARAFAAAVTQGLGS